MKMTKWWSRAVLLFLMSSCLACNIKDADVCTEDLRTAIFHGVSVQDKFCKPLDKLDDIKSCVVKALSGCSASVFQTYNATVYKNASVVEENKDFCLPGCKDWLGRMAKMQACQAFGISTPNNPCSGPRQASACTWDKAKECPFLENLFVKMMGSTLSKANKDHNCGFKFPGVLLPTVAPQTPKPECDLKAWENCTEKLRYAANAGPSVTNITCPMIGQVKNVQKCASQSVVGCNGTIILQKHKDIQSLSKTLQDYKKYCEAGCENWFVRYLSMQQCISIYGTKEIPNNPCGSVRQTAACAWDHAKGCPYLTQEFVRSLGYAIAQKNKDHNCNIDMEGVTLPVIDENDCASVMKECNLHSQTKSIQNGETLSDQNLRIVCRQESCVKKKKVPTATLR